MSAGTASLCSTLFFSILIFVSADQKIITAESGQDVTLTCRAPNNNIRSVHWSRADLTDGYVLLYQDGQFVPDHQHPSFKNRVDLQDRQMKDGDVSLFLNNVKINDAETYMCRVFIEETRSWKNSIIIHLHVFPPGQKKITAESGQDVTLTCRAPNNNIKSVHWSRADLTDEYVLFYQKGQFVPEYQHPSFKNRVDLQDRQMKDGDVSLILKDVTNNDAGTYECRVVSRTKHGRRDVSTEPISIIHLHVVPPEKKTIKVKSGQDVTLTCRASNNKIKSVHWSRADLTDGYVLLYQDGQFVPDHQHPSFKNRVDLQDRQMKDGDVSLILNNVKINDAGTYGCRVFIEETRSWKNSIIIHLTVVDPPDQKIITAESGQDVTLTCRAPNNNIRVVVWGRADLGDKYVLLYQDKQFVPDSQHPSFNNRVDLQDRQMKDGDVSLILKDVTINDAARYKCHVLVNETDSWKLVSIIHLRVSPDQKNITAESGQDVTLTCRAPNNNFRDVEWSRDDLTSDHVFLYQDGHFLLDSQHPSFMNRVDLQDRQMKDGDVSLILKDVTINDAGTYKCRVVQRVRGPMTLISIIHLHVDPPGQTGGHTQARPRQTVHRDETRT
uniref:Ig-like domain-containing protein n=1 Tax=Oreochromis niloticus TaxID=8128 RepID=A0A669F6W9_ORENI